MTDQVYDRGPAWWTHSMPCDQETAVMQFEARYGYPPEKVMEEKGYIYLGPVVVSEDTDE